MKNMRAIDLYSGIGGWAIGLQAAGIDVVASYEWWAPAADTERQNLGTDVYQLDIRELSLSSLPENIDIVVGSPPCTQFSYANRGGSGDITDGLKDIEKFLQVVEHLSPKYWVMENVPRIKKILEKEMTKGGLFERFSNLFTDIKIEVFDLSEFGLPQKRKRCLAGNFPLEILENYKTQLETKTLGEAINSLENKTVSDVNFGIEIDRDELTEHEKETFLDDEEERINREAKSFHPVYNVMQFPDELTRPVRTITATCTRVSRESIVIRDLSRAKKFRRLTVRERGTLQGFPINYQFFGKSHSEKLKMIGNAVPPVFSYYLAQALLGTKAENLVKLDQSSFQIATNSTLPKPTKPDTQGKAFPKDRRFWFAVPNLLFKSGTRFDLVNKFEKEKVDWQIEFYFGPSKDIRSIKLDKKLLSQLKTLNWFPLIDEKFSECMSIIESHFNSTDFSTMQQRWTDPDKSIKGHHPFTLLDSLGDTAKKLTESFPREFEENASSFIKQIARKSYPNLEPVSEPKLSKYAAPIFCGLYLGAWFNSTEFNSLH